MFRLHQGLQLSEVRNQFTVWAIPTAFFGCGDRVWLNLQRGENRPADALPVRLVQQIVFIDDRNVGQVSERVEFLLSDSNAPLKLTQEILDGYHNTIRLQRWFVIAPVLLPLGHLPRDCHIEQAAPLDMDKLPLKAMQIGHQAG